MNRVVIVNGFPRSGKDSFVAAARLKALPCVHVSEMSTVSKVKEIAALMGWNGVKDDAGRRFLHELKMAWSKYNSGPFNSVIEKVNSLNAKFPEGSDKDTCLFVYSREPGEIERFKRTIGENCSTLLIVRPGIDTFDNPADKGVENYTYDYVIINETCDDYEEKLREKAEKFMKSLFSNGKRA